MSRKDELITIIEAARLELHTITEAESAEANAALIGRCYKYQNSDSLSSDNSWWDYYKVVGISDGDIVTWNFETDRYGTVTITPKSLHGILDVLMIEITESEFMAAWKELLERLNTL